MSYEEHEEGIVQSSLSRKETRQSSVKRTDIELN